MMKFIKFIRNAWLTTYRSLVNINNVEMSSQRKITEMTFGEGLSFIVNRITERAVWIAPTMAICLFLSLSPLGTVAFFLLVGTNVVNNVLFGTDADDAVGSFI